VAGLTVTVATTLETITGSSGIDTITFAAGSTATMTGGGGADVVNLGTGTNVLSYTSTGGTAVITATSGNDTVTVSGSGNATIVGSTGTDSLTGGSGNDTFKFVGGEVTSADSINGGSGSNDILEIITTAGSVDVTNVSNIDRILYTIGGTNTITGALSGVIIDGTSGTALGLTLGAGTNTVTLENIIAASTFTGNTGADTITYTGSVATSVAGVAGNDVLTTGTGNDTLNGGDGADAMTGGTGNNVFVYSSATNSSGANVDTIADFNSGDVLQLALTMTGTTFTSTDRGAVATLGDSGGNLTGVAGDMVFITGTSQLAVDTDGNGTISGTDYRIALTGNTVVPTGAGVTFNITGSGNGDTITTGVGADSISGEAGVDVITGGAGADSITGGAGADVFLIALAADHATGEVITGGTESDTIRFTSTTASTLTLLAGVTEVELAVISDAAGTTTGTTALNIDATAAIGTIALTGNAGANTLTGNASVNVITGGAGADTIITGGGADEITFASYGDSGTTAAPATTFDTITSALNIQTGAAGVLKFKAPGGAATGTAVAAAANATAFTSAAGWLALVNGVFNGGTLNAQTYGLTLITFSGGTGDGAAFNGVYALVNGATGAANFDAADGDYIVKLTGTLTGTLNTAFFDFVA
jgi:Ca2+-binding RTX toxin-like protein